MAGRRGGRRRQRQRGQAAQIHASGPIALWISCSRSISVGRNAAASLWSSHGTGRARSSSEYSRASERASWEDCYKREKGREEDGVSGSLSISNAPSQVPSLSLIGQTHRTCLRSALSALPHQPSSQHRSRRHIYREKALPDTLLPLPALQLDKVVEVK